jgi:hemerythrin superfamily protein
MDVTSLVEREHRELEKLFKTYERIRRERRGDDGATEKRQNVLRDIIRALSAHAAAEEQVLYPVVRAELPDGQRLATAALDEHQRVKEALDTLAGTPLEDGEFDRRLQAIILDVQHHVEKEEGEIVDKLRAWLGKDRLRELGEAFASAEQFAPTRPHPWLPQTPPLNAAAGTAAAVADRVLDVAEEGKARAAQAASAAAESLGAVAGARMSRIRRRARGAAGSMEGAIETGRRRVRRIAEESGVAGGGRSRKRSRSRSKTTKKKSASSGSRRKRATANGRASRSR